MMRCILVLLAFHACHGEQTTVNPIRKIVTLMQNMQKEIEAEGAKEKELYDKFMCYCQGGESELAAKIDKASAEMETLGAKLKAETAEKTTSSQELAQHKTDREGATSDLEEATMLRGKEAAEFAATKADMETNLAAMAGAIPALEKGMGGASFVQLPEASAIKKIANTSPSLDEMDKRTLMSFLEQSGDYAPASGQIVGILKAMEDDMKKSLEETVADEEKAVAGFGELKASKEKEVELASEAIETKTARVGELAVSIAETADGLEDATAEKAETEKFVATLKEQCGTKAKEFAAATEARATEVAAISEAIGILNDDDALDVFKKALPSALIQNSFLQKGGSKASMLQKVQGLIAAGSKFRSPQLSLLLFTLRSKVAAQQRQGTHQFEEIVTMIDGMVTLLGKENGEDAKQKAWCESEFEKSADEDAAAKSKMSAISAEIGEISDEIAELSEAINTLTGEVAELDKAVADATASRKADHAAFVESQQLGEVAIGLIYKASQRLQKFYNPTLYKAAPKTEMTMEEKIITAGTFAQIHAHVALPPAPALLQYEKKTEKSAGVLALMDTISSDLKAEMKDAGFAEKTAQSEYADLMTASQATRAADTKSVVDKEAAKATMEEKLMTAKKAHSATKEEISLIDSYVADLHVSCDFIMQNFDLRLEARTAEIESLKNAKAVLAGASYGR